MSDGEKTQPLDPARTPEGQMVMATDGVCAGGKPVVTKIHNIVEAGTHILVSTCNSCNGPIYYQPVNACWVHGVAHIEVIERWPK